MVPTVIGLLGSVTKNLDKLGTRINIHCSSKNVSCKEQQCFQSEEMDFKGSLVAGYDHDWPHWELYLY